jgi:hypothetical protein
LKNTLVSSTFGKGLSSGTGAVACAAAGAGCCCCLVRSKMEKNRGKKIINIVSFAKTQNSTRFECIFTSSPLVSSVVFATLNKNIITLLLFFLLLLREPWSRPRVSSQCVQFSHFFESHRVGPQRQLQKLNQYDRSQGYC